MGRIMVASKRVLAMNLAILKKSRHTPRVGDVFVMQPPDHQFLFGRVVQTDANPLGVGGAILIYIYQARSSDKAKVPDLRREELLLPPIMTNGMPWVKGYFENIAHAPLSSTDRLPQHCFKDSRGWYFDESGNRLPYAMEPVGQWGLHSYRSIDDEVSNALGIPLATSD